MTDLELGQTTQRQVLERYGVPLDQASVMQGPVARFASAIPKSQSTLIYAYSDLTKLGPGARSARLAMFGFQNGFLRSMIFGSTYPKDQRDFDPAVVEQLLKRPALTRKDLVAALGPPEGRISDPAAAYAERDGWYVFEHRNDDGRVSTERVEIGKSFTADIAKDSRVMAHKLVINNPR